MASPVDGRPITSLKNPLVKRLRSLQADRDAREREGRYLAWGLHLAEEALAARAPIQQALVGEALAGSAQGRAILSALRAAGTPIVPVGAAVLETIAEGAGDQGILLVIGRRSPDLAALLRARPTLLLLLHGVQDPGNLGAIVRSARGFGAAALILLEGTTDPYGIRAVRASMGTIFSLPVVGASAVRLRGALREAGLSVVAADPGGDRLPPEIDFRAPTAILVGNEGAGLPADVLASASARVRIPMAEGVESLNVHAAVVALLYEAARQRSFPG